MKQIAALALVAFVAAGCGGSAKPAAADVTAARACETFSKMITAVQHGQDDKTQSRTLVGQVTHLHGTPRMGLGADLITAAAALNSGDLTALRRAEDPVVAGCAALPTSAKTAGGFTR